MQLSERSTSWEVPNTLAIRTEGRCKFVSVACNTRLSKVRISNGISALALWPSHIWIRLSGTIPCVLNRRDFGTCGKVCSFMVHTMIGHRLCDVTNTRHDHTLPSHPPCWTAESRMDPSLAERKDPGVDV